MKKRVLGCALALLCSGALLDLPLARADNAPSTGSVSLAGFYLSGKYGHSKSTDILYVPFTVRLQSGRFTWSATLPYLQISGPGNVLPNIGSVGAGSNVRTTNSGMGDIRLGADYRVWSDNSSGVALTVGGRVKLGTADHAAGLGTGKNDYALQLRLSRATGKLYLAATAGYRKQGSPTGLQLRNVAYGKADIIYSFSRSNSLGFSTFYDQASLATGTSLLTSALYFSHHLDDQWSATFFAMKGYTRNSPGYGAGISLSYGF